MYEIIHTIFVTEGVQNEMSGRISVSFVMHENTYICNKIDDYDKTSMYLMIVHRDGGSRFLVHGPFIHIVFSEF